jgi:hypothetical protein
MPSTYCIYEEDDFVTIEINWWYASLNIYINIGEIAHIWFAFPVDIYE